MEVENTKSELTVLLTELLLYIFLSLVHSAILFLISSFYIPNTVKLIIPELNFRLQVVESSRISRKKKQE